MKIFQPQFAADCNDQPRSGPWLIKAEDEAAAFSKAQAFYHAAGLTVRPFLVPHRDAFVLVGVKEVEFGISGILLLD